MLPGLLGVKIMSGIPNKTTCFITEQFNDTHSRDDVGLLGYRTVTVNELNTMNFSCSYDIRDKLLFFNL